MGLLNWNWKFYIAPAPLIERQNPYNDHEISYRNWGMYVTRKIFRGLKHPIAGDMVNIPNYGPCKVERVIYWTNRPSRRFVLGVVISPDSLGNQKWWSENKNDPVSKFPENWTFDFELPKPYFKDIEILPNGPVS